MSLRTIYGSHEEALAAPCGICEIPNREHTEEAALECWRKILRHPDADADNILAALGGAVVGVVRQKNILTMNYTATSLLSEIETAIKDREARS